MRLGVILNRPGHGAGLSRPCRIHCGSQSLSRLPFFRLGVLGAAEVVRDAGGSRAGMPSGDQQ
jgi:hypothetical protein